MVSDAELHALAREIRVFGQEIARLTAELVRLRTDLLARRDPYEVVVTGPAAAPGAGLCAAREEDA